MLIMSRLLGGLFSKFIMPAQQRFPKGDPLQSGLTTVKGQRGEDISLRRHLVSSTHNATVALFEIGKTQISKETRVILHGFDGADIAENHFSELNELYQKHFPNAIVAAMNYRNVASSGVGTVRTEQDWV